MKIKLDENLPADIAEVLTVLGHDVHTVPDENLGGKSDDVIFMAAIGEGRLLVTQDLDFSDVRRFKPGTHPGIVLIRLHDPSRRRLLDRMKQILQTETIENWRGCFVVVGDRKLRVRRP
jgi:predicted nuclease of predicted toxin-antitoxin system